MSLYIFFFSSSNTRKLIPSLGYIILCHIHLYKPGKTNTFTNQENVNTDKLVH